MTRGLRHSRYAALLALGTLSACSNAKPSQPPFVFNRPERVEFVCLDPNGSAVQGAGVEDTQTTPLVLPTRCCAASGTMVPDPNDPAVPASIKNVNRDCPFETVNPQMHALVTQSTRGEVASANLSTGRVVDSDVLVPGATFVDVGGLPTAVVVPPSRFLRPEGSDSEARQEQGSPWVYVASAEDQEVRAVATCRFAEAAGDQRMGQDTRCGPGGTAINRDFVVERTRLPLPAAPRDMVLIDEDGDAGDAPEALWVTLPDLGLIARIALSDVWQDPFVMETDPNTGESRAAQPQFYRVPDASGAQASEPLTEMPPYYATCGLGYAYTPVTPVLPSATQATSNGAPSPTRIRFDVDSGLLLVADGNQPVLHAFRVAPSADPSAAPTLLAQGALALGAPARDFAFTAAVPSVPLSNPGSPYAAGFSSSAEPTANRYLYAIDDRDGTVMAFAYSASDSPSVTPLLVPDTARFRDRVNLPGVANALDVIDTRGLNDYVCGEGADKKGQALIDSLTTLVKNQQSTVTDKQKQVDDLQAQVDANPNDQAKKDELAAAQSELTDARNQLATLQSQLSIVQAAGPTHLRGVFVAVVTVDGTVTVLDVHDLDDFCRADKSCTDKDGNFTATTLGASDSATSLAVHRHAQRIASARAPVVVVSNGEQLDTLTCPDGYIDPQQADGVQSSRGSIVCTPADPWRNFNTSWSVRYEGSIPTLAGDNGAFQMEGDKLVLLAPMEFNFCSRGAEVGDAVYVTGAPAAELANRCPTPTSDTAQRLPIVEAYQNRLVLDTSELTTSLDTLLGCYPDFVGFEVHPQGQFLVLASGTYFHHRTTAADGSESCIDDPTKDPRLVGRVSAGGVFDNLYVKFKLPELPDNANPAAILPLLQVSQSTSRLFTVDYDSAGAAALPVSVRYLPYTGELFVVDAANQGLRRFTLAPFARSTTSFR